MGIMARRRMSDKKKKATPKAAKPLPVTVKPPQPEGPPKPNRKVEKVPASMLHRDN